MTYLISQDWLGTSKNHAGIKYLCNTIAESYPNEFTSVVIPVFSGFISPKLFFAGRLNILIRRYQHKKYVQNLLNQIKLQAGDSVVLMEYMDTIYPILNFARKIKSEHPYVKVCGMVHLVPQKLTSAFDDESFKRWVSSVDELLTLGHSLTDYLIGRGAVASHVHTMFHYVDGYYYNEHPIRDHNKIRVIAMGNQMRNVELLKKVVDVNKNVDFTICQGVSNLSEFFKNNSNVKLIPFIEECELRKAMENSDISINIMKDTIGSNVIGTSLAMGLAMLCSDVGSIRDYCCETNTIFCSTEADFSSAINLLDQNRNLLASMQVSAAERAKDLTITKFVGQLRAILA